MLEKIMATEEAITSSNSGFVENPVGGSNPPALKKKRNLPGTPGKLASLFVYFSSFWVCVCVYVVIILSVRLSLSVFMIIYDRRYIQSYSCLSSFIALIFKWEYWFFYADPEAEVIALSPKTLMATNRFLCEICGKGFQRDQNLQLHRRGHNLPWKLKQRTNKEVKKRVYVCPEKTCVHHHPSRALGDLTGIKKHFCRKHGEKKWKCEKCSKRYAVQSDWKAHSKTCGTREYKCDCGTLFSRYNSFQRFLFEFIVMVVLKYYRFVVASKG